MLYIYQYKVELKLLLIVKSEKESRGLYRSRFFSRYFFVIFFVVLSLSGLHDDGGI